MLGFIIVSDKIASLWTLRDIEIRGPGEPSVLCGRCGGWKRIHQIERFRSSSVPPEAGLNSPPPGQHPGQMQGRSGLGPATAAPCFMISYQCSYVIAQPRSSRVRLCRSVRPIKHHSALNYGMPKRVGKYLIHQTLGEGTFGKCVCGARIFSGIIFLYICGFLGEKAMCCHRRLLC